jgi:hypothetical protein
MQSALLKNPKQHVRRKRKRALDDPPKPARIDGDHPKQLAVIVEAKKQPVMRCVAFAPRHLAKRRCFK